MREEVASLKQAKQTVEQDHTIALKNAEIAAEESRF